jgi:putative ABC transport system permease protein
VRAIPGVQAATTTSEPPVSGYQQTFSFAIEGRPAANPSGREDPVSLRAVSPGYFETMRIPVERGRALSGSDRRGAPSVVVINRALADIFWADVDPIGARISFVGAGGPWHEIVGVVGDTRHDGLDEPERPALYVPYAQRRPNWSWLSWQVVLARARPGVDAAAITPAIRDAVWSLDPGLPLHVTTTIERIYDESLARRRFAMQVAVGFALLALLLTAIGIYGVVSLAVGARRHEIGVRAALGARPRQVVGLMMRTGLVAAGAGVALGSLLAIGATRLVGALLFDAGRTDPAAFGATAAALLLLAALAAWLPARRAAAVEPVRALRGE